MTDEQIEQLRKLVNKLETIAVVNVATVDAQAKIAGMQAFNKDRPNDGSGAYYGQDQFMAVADELNTTLVASGLSL